MGCKFSCRSTSTFRGVRVVHINGYVEDYPGPVTVGDVTGKPPKLVCFSPAQLLSFSPRPLGLDDRLEPGRLYFLLPHTVFHSDSSPVDLATLVTRLSAFARNGAAASRPKLVFSGDGRVDSRADGHAGSGLAAKLGPGAWDAYCTGRVGAGRMSAKVRSWKPILDAIQERSFGRSTRSLNSQSSIRCQAREVGGRAG